MVATAMLVEICGLDTVFVVGVGLLTISLDESPHEGDDTGERSAEEVSATISRLRFSVIVIILMVVRLNIDINGPPAADTVTVLYSVARSVTGARAEHLARYAVIRSSCRITLRVLLSQTLCVCTELALLRLNVV